MMSRPTTIVGNWKMHKTVKEAIDFIDALIPQIEGATCDILLAVPFTAIYASCLVVAGAGAQIAIGAQNTSDREEGPLTGEISARMLKAAGSSFVILGHSERRVHFGETDAMVHAKLRRAIGEKLTAILCIGESEADRDGGKSEDVLKKQLDGCLGECQLAELGKIFIAYEPLWAIGTGKAATPEIAQETHSQIRAHLVENWGKLWAAQVCLLYGGSVTPANIDPLLQQPDIDGALIGGASLDVATFSQMACR